MKNDKGNIQSELEHGSLMLICSRSIPHVLRIFKILNIPSSTFLHSMLTTLRCAHTNDYSIVSWAPVALASCYMTQTICQDQQNIHDNTFNSATSLYVQESASQELECVGECKLGQ
jgi:hypothetical protein